jgi:hypothetical protein
MANEFLLWVVAPHMEFTQSYITKNLAALKALKLESRLVHWYSFPQWRHHFLPSWFRGKGEEL